MTKMNEPKCPKPVQSDTAPEQVPEKELDGVAGGAFPSGVNEQLIDCVIQVN